MVKVKVKKTKAKNNCGDAVGDTSTAALTQARKKRAAAVDNARVVVDEQQREGLEAEALEAVIEGIADPEAQARGRQFVPEQWGKKFKPVLGNYKQWLQSHPDKFVLIMDGKGDFVIRQPGDLEDSVPYEMPWGKPLNRAWEAYCREVRRGERDFRAFMAPLLLNTKSARNSLTLASAVKAAKQLGDASVEEVLCGRKTKKKGRTEKAEGARIADAGHKTFKKGRKRKLAAAGAVNSEE